jgi:hypothetical protein
MMVMLVLFVVGDVVGVNLVVVVVVVVVVVLTFTVLVHCRL